MCADHMLRHRVSLLSRFQKNQTLTESVQGPPGNYIMGK